MRLEKFSNQQLEATIRAWKQLEHELLDDAFFSRFHFDEDVRKQGLHIASYNHSGFVDLENGWISTGDKNDEIDFIFYKGAVLVKGITDKCGVVVFEKLDKHEAPDKYKIWKGIYDGVPSYLRRPLASIGKEHVSFCYWREANTGKWEYGTKACCDVKFIDQLLDALPLSPVEFHQWVEENYADDENASEISLQRIQEVFEASHQQFTQKTD